STSEVPGLLEDILSKTLRDVVCRPQLVGNMVPSKFCFLSLKDVDGEGQEPEELPKTATGKVDRNALKGRYWNGEFDRRVSHDRGHGHSSASASSSTTSEDSDSEDVIEDVHRTSSGSTG
ncbi:unnamed protein product, partial [Amoebophrya sp. A25]